MTAPVPIREYDVAAKSTNVFGRVAVSARDVSVLVDGPVQNGCLGVQLTPPEVFLASVAACSVELVTVIAKETNVSVGPVDVTVHGMLDRSKQSREGLTVFNSVHMKVHVKGTDGATAAQLVESFKRR